MQSHLFKVTLDGPTGSAVRRIAATSDQSMSSVIASFLQPHVSYLKDLADSLESVNTLREEAGASQAGFLEEVVALVIEANENDGMLPSGDAEDGLQSVANLQSLQPGRIRTIGAPGKPGYMELPDDPIERQKLLIKKSGFDDIL